MSMDKWQWRYYMMAVHVSSWSKDPSTNVGAVLVGADRRQIAVGYNGIPPGLIDSEERLNDRQVKYIYVQHAERNVLDNAWFDVRGATLAVTAFPCVECTKSLISKGVALVIAPPPPPPIATPSWRDTLKYSASMMREAGVVYIEAPTSR
jgi:dCMP deaminase